MNLSTEHKALFSLLRAGLWEREADDLSPFPLTDAQWWEVYRMSVRQTVAGIVFRGLHHLPEEYLPADALMIHWVAKADRIERKNRRMDAALRLLLQLLGREGLHPVLLKGQGVAALYEHPLLRECGDIDLCFPSEKEEREAAELVRRVGCRTERHPDGSVCYSWQGVEVEHHTRLFDLHNPLLRGYLSSLVGRHGFTDIRTEDGATLPVPAPLPDLLLLNAHLLKHIMGHGVGLRQFCDIGLWALEYHDEIDWQRLHDQCASVHAATFAAAAFRIARDYLGIDFDLPMPWDASIDVEPLLHDTLCGGVYGSNDLTRLHSSTVTLNAVKASRTGEKSSVLRTVFPKREYLERRYPYLKKRPYLLPVAWVQRIAHYASEKQAGTDNSASGSIKLGKERIELMKRYGIMD